MTQTTKYDMSIHTNPDAMAWTKFFREMNPDCNVPDDLMLTWFANAMMAMQDHMNGGGPLNGDHAQHLIDEAMGDGVDNGKPKSKTTKSEPDFYHSLDRHTGLRFRDTMTREQFNEILVIMEQEHDH